MAVKNVIKAITAANFDAGDLTTSFQLVTTLPVPCFYLKMINASDNIVVVSYDGVNPHDVVLPNSGYDVNGQANSALSTGIANFAAGTTVYVLSESTDAGDIFVIGYYQPQG